ncbi:MAG: tyrosine--tRNA ligase [Candidatus Hydrogenedentota bacterium]|nr:MAG: tyrosine--tRNA ligase [Candidatus Hydrogenedentota bacterium]
MAERRSESRILLRGVEESIGDLEEKLRLGRPLRVKAGFDPTAPDLHLGHLVLLRKLRHFQDAGHRVQFLIGDFTAMIGDPSGRNETRPPLSREQIEENARTYCDQVFRILDESKTDVVFNSEWLEKLGASGLLRLAGQRSVARMLERDDFKKRFEQNQEITIAEFLYPLLQGYDSVALESDVELGGTDQRFNLLMGRLLQERYGQAPQVILMLPLIEGLDGVRKMSKSYGNAVGVTEPPEEIFGKLMSIPDELTARYLILLTDVDEDEVEQMVREGHPRDVKARLAWEVVAQLYDSGKADAARGYFDRVFREKAVPEGIEERVWDGNSDLASVLAEAGCVSSKSEARRLIAQGGIRVRRGESWRKVTAIEEVFDGEPEAILRIGKRGRFLRVRR